MFDNFSSRESAQTTSHLFASTMSANGMTETAPPLRSSKRKRDQVSYLDDDYFDELDLPETQPEDDEDEVSDAEEDEAYGRKVKIRRPCCRVLD